MKPLKVKRFSQTSGIAILDIQDYHVTFAYFDRGKYGEQHGTDNRLDVNGEEYIEDLGRLHYLNEFC